MNVLVSFLRGHPEAVDRLTDGEQASLEQVVDAKDGFEFPYLLDRDTVDFLTRGRPNGHLLQEAYLPVMERVRWQAQLESAEPADLPESIPFAMREHATFAPGQWSTRGVTLPDDDDPANLRLSLFARGPSSLQRVSIEYARGPGPPTGVSISLARDCSLPDWGECHREECSGDCSLKRVHNDDDGLVCRCPHPK